MGGYRARTVAPSTKASASETPTKTIFCWDLSRAADTIIELFILARFISSVIQASRHWSWVVIWHSDLLLGTVVF